MKRNSYSLNFISLYVTMGVCIWCSPLLAQNAVVYSQFNPPVIHLGQSSSYEITVYGTQDVSQETIRGKLRSVDGLKISNNSSVSSEFKFIQGTRTTSITYSFNVQAEREGEFTIEAWQVNIKGRNYKVPAAKLEVVPQGKEFEKSMFLKLEIPKENFYVGESIPCHLKFYLRRDIQARMRAYPEKTGDAFTQSELRKEPHSSQETIDGQIYRLFSWPLTLTALKAGEEVLSYKIELAVILPNKRSRRSPFDTLFNDSFFNTDSLFNRGSFENITLFTGDIPKDVLELPIEGKPDNFSGAIGVFELKTRLSATTVEAGEPITLTLDTSGEGNFDRIAAPVLTETDNFKLYPPKTEFTPIDDIGYRGKKSFEYIIIPQSEEVNAIPPMAFNFFDPNLGRYKDLSTQSTPIEVLPASVPISSSTSTIIAEQTEITVEAKLPPALLPIQLLPGRWVDDITPVFKKPVFMIGQLLPIILISLVALIRRRQLRFQHDEIFARRVSGSKSVRQWLTKARKAASRNDNSDFFESAQRALQECVGRHFPRRSESLILAEIESYLKEHNAADELHHNVRQFFNAADAIKFADGISESEPLSKWEKTLNKLLNDIEALR
jgi:hypothetical protein